jgi:hypothetical protein
MPQEQPPSSLAWEVPSESENATLLGDLTLLAEAVERARDEQRGLLIAVYRPEAEEDNPAGVCVYEVVAHWRRARRSLTASEADGATFVLTQRFAGPPPQRPPGGTNTQTMKLPRPALEALAILPQG